MERWGSESEYYEAINNSSCDVCFPSSRKPPPTCSAGRRRTGTAIYFYPHFATSPSTKPRSPMKLLACSFLFTGAAAFASGTIHSINSSHRPSVVRSSLFKINHKIQMSTKASEEEEEALVQTASSYCASNGILMGARDRSTNQPLGANIYEPAPFSLHPTLLPRAAFDKAYEMAVPFNNVVHRAASKYDGWLRDAVKTAAEGDKDFTGKMLGLADDVVQKGRVQNVALGLLRSDYMLHCEAGGSVEDGEDAQKRQFDSAIPLQVELNTIASSFGCLSSKITRMHQHLESLGGPTTGEGALPDNGAAEGVAEGLAMALKEYQRQREEHGGKSDDANDIDEVVVVMVVQPGETNSVDQRDLEFLLQQKHGVRLVRRSLNELATAASMSNGDGGDFLGRELIIPDGDKKVAAGVVYYRAGYTPDDYPSDTEWEGRGKVEHSAAIKCPDIFYHVFGTKKVQQVLAEPNVLRQFCESDEEEKLLSSSFAGLYALGEGDDSAAVEAALSNPHGYVLKPQREGGGNNLYDDDLVRELKSMSYEERGAFILMQKIMPPSVPGKLVRGGEIVYDGPTVCELGVFGISLRRYSNESGKDGDGDGDDEILLNKVVGHILRAKSVQTDEGGVAAGYAFLSSPRVV